MAVLKLFPTDYTLALSLLALFLYLVVSLIRRRVPRNFPPGPTPLPLIGNFHQLDLKKLDWSLMGLAEKYGSVFSVELGPSKAVVLTGYDAVKDALVNHADQFSGRPHLPIFDTVSFRSGVIFSDGKLWWENRKFVISALRGFGMGKKSVEDRISEEASFLVNVFESHKGQPFETAQIMYLAVSNIICSIIFGDRFDYNNEVFIHLTSMINESMRLLGTAPIHLYNFYPSLGFLIPSRRKIIQNLVKMHEIFEGCFKAAKETLSENSIQTFSEALILRHQQELGGEDLESKKKDIVVTITDLFTAGTETTSTTLCWGLLLMVNHPEIQRKVQDEIDRVIGAGRFPRTEDQRHMPYTEAVIHEIQRFANIVPILPHSTTEDTHFRGYFLPKGTYVIPLLTSVLYDKTQWEKPHQFNPAHFLDADGNFVKRDAFMPFSAGRRVCAGEALAKVELFLFFTTLLQKFHFQAPPGVNDLDISPGIGLVSNPKPHRVCAVSR
ncbi:cytochrome P450 2K1-like isoform X1 [Hemiscyllium ocellatum]|uniref:cytochrome P450 2K1-like isoform X1 n=1 Tax=Hemiscyllium ocellatum TaxID=170820 RepID=UPI0029669AA5|nr:cytochrome P450 2K1-like isoform X1 [Hemiscyllium ocellatum]